jgi:hypothetical protein
MTPTPDLADHAGPLTDAERLALHAAKIAAERAQRDEHASGGTLPLECLPEQVRQARRVMDAMKAKK